jgi:translocation and assembly module TamB
MAESSRSPANRLGLLAAGLLLGLILALVAVRLYVREAERERVETAIRQRVQLPEEAFEVEEILPDRTIRASMRRVAVLDRAGDTIVSAPRVRFVFDPSSLAGEGPLVFRDVDVERPTLRLVQQQDGEWNLAEAFALEADGAPVRPGAEEEGRGFVLRGMRITGGRVLLATPWSPDDSLLAGTSPRLVRLAGTTMLLRTARDLEARVPLVRFGGERGWRVEVAEASAFLAEPQVGRVALRGWAEEAGEGFRFGLDALRTGRSFLEGRGTVRLAGEAPAYDVTLRAAPLAFRDLQWIRPSLPDEGTARFRLEVETRPGGRTAFDFSDLEVRARDSRVFGRLAVLTREGAAPTFYDTRLTLDPLLLSDLEALGFVEDIPYTGRITGTIASVEAFQGSEGSLRIDLAGSLSPEGVPGAPPAVLAAHGLVAFGDEGVRLRDVRVEADPLPLVALSPFVESGREYLQGVVRGSALLSGTLQDLRISSGLVAYEVGDAPVSRLRLAEGRIRMGPELRYEIDARAEPLALATLTELFPALPFRAATLTGPISLSGTRESLRFDADLRGAAGGIAARGTVAFGETPRFDVSGRLEAFRTGAVLAGGAPIEGPLTGTFSVRGTAADLRFAVDLAQGGGSFALQGRVRGAAGARQFDVSGRVNNFRLGTLIGRPGLLPSPVTGTIALAGGGRQPYRFDVDVRGGVGVLDLEGWYAPGAVPTYSVSGAVAGLNLEGLPQAGVLPGTNLTGTLSLRGQGTTLETFSGELSFRATGPSTIGGLPLETAVVDLAVRGGILVVDELLLALGGARLAAEGTLGLTRPAGGGLRFSFVAQDLSTLTGVVPPPGPLEPDMAGSVHLTGTVSGSVRSPEVAASLRANGLRFNEWRAGSLVAAVRASRRAGTWVGEGSLQGERLVLAGGESLQSLRLEANATPATASFGVFARRNAESDIAASGALDLVDGELRGARLEALTLRLGATTWQLQHPSRIRWGGIEGVEVERLRLRRTGTATGWIEVDGRLPPTGRADLRVRAAGVDLAELRRIAGRGPEVAGILTLEATMEGPVEEPGLVLRASIDSLRYAGAAADRVALDARYEGRRLVGDAGAWLRGTQVLTATYAVPLRISWEGLIPSAELLDNGALAARVVADSVPLGLLTASLPGVSEGTGSVGARVEVGGTPADPRVRGWAQIVGGGLSVDTLGTRWDSIYGRVSMEGERVRIDSLVAKSGGHARLDGTVRLTSLRAPEIHLVTTLSDFQVVDKPDVAELAVSGRVALSGRLPQPVVSGLIVLDEGTIYIPELDEQRTELEIAATEIGEIGADTIPEAVTASTTSVLGGLQADNLEVRVEDDVWLESRDARIQIAGELRIDRTGGGIPQVFGNLEAVRGLYTLEIGPFRREFEIERGLVEFFGTPELNPALDIRAVHEVRSLAGERGRSSVLRIIVNITGTLEQPRLSLTSDTRPPLPEEELFNYLVFGRPSFALGGGTGALAQQVLLESFLSGYLAGELERTLAGTGVVDFVRVRTGPIGGFAGLSPVDFGSALGLGATTVELGTEIAEGLFLTAEIGVGSLLADDFLLGLGLEWEIDPHWSVRAAREVPRVPSRFRFYENIFEGVDYQYSADLFWRREFGLPRPDSSVLGPPPGARLPGVIAPVPEAPRREEPQRRGAPPRETPRTEERENR